MRVLLSDRSAKIGGRASMMRTVVSVLQTRGHHCEVMLRGGPELRQLRALAARTWWLPPAAGWAARRAHHVIRLSSIDVVNTHTTRTAQHLLPACVATRVPLVMTVLNSTSLAVCADAVSYASAVIVLNRSTRDFLVAQRPDIADKVALLDKPIDLDVFSPAPRPGDGAFRAVYLGRLSSTKGERAMTVIEACGRIADSLPDLQLQVVGGGSRLRPTRQLASEVNARVGREVVRVTGATHHPEECLRRADVVIGAGFSAAEGLACGCQVIGVGFLGLFGLVTGQNVTEALDSNFGDTGTRWPGADADLVAEQILAAYQQRSDDRSWARRLAEERFAAPVAVGKIEQVLEEAARRR